MPSLFPSQNENGLSYSRWCYAARVNPLNLTREQRKLAMLDWVNGIDPTDYNTPKVG